MENEVTITNAYIAEMDQTPEFLDLFKKKVSDPMLRYWLGSRFKGKLSKRARDYARTRTEIMMDFARKDDDGKPVYELDEKGKATQPVIDDPLGYRIELNKLLDGEIPLGIPKFRIKMVDLPESWDSQDLYMLAPFLDVEGTE